MPLTILVRSTDSPSEKSPPALIFDGDRIVLGRGPGSDVRLPDPSVSHRHASIHAKGSEFTIVDEGSTNGTFLGGVRLAPFAPRLLRSGDLVRIGRVWVEVRVDQTPPTHDLAIATRELAFALVSQAMRALGEDIVTKIRVAEGASFGSVLRLEEEGRSYIIGRDEGCDLLLDDRDASRAHAQAVLRNGTVLLQDLGAKNGIWLGEERMPPKSDVLWRPAAMVRLGQTVLTLEEPVSSALHELEHAEDELMASNEVVPPPGPTNETSELLGADQGAQAAPIAQVPLGAAASRLKKLRWSGADAAVLLAATIVFALSLAGLFWLLRG